MDIDGVILAAGLSKRAGVHKMLLKMGDSTVIEKSIEGMHDICSRIIVVVGYKADDVLSVIKRYDKVYVVHNDNYYDGMYSSVRIGFNQVNTKRFFFIPGDYPLVTGDVYKKMLSTYGDIVIPVFKGRLGHPVLMNGSLAKEVVNNKDYLCLRDFIYNKGFVTVDVNDFSILTDVDTIEDYFMVLNSMMSYG